MTDQGGAVGHGGEVVVLTLVAGAPCTLKGYPGLGLKGPAGQTVPLTVNRQTDAGFLLPYVKPAQVLLSVAAPASFGIEWINMFKPTATTVVVTPPDDFTAITVGGGVQGGVPENSVVTVTAVITGQLQFPLQDG